MERIDFENTIRKMKKEPNADYRLLSAFESYFIFNYEGFEHPRILFQSKLDSDDDTLELKETTPEELLLRKRIEEARKKETFSDMLLRLIRESGKTAPEVYRGAGIDPRHFSKINSNKDYRPTKETVLAFAIALHLSCDDT